MTQAYPLQWPQGRPRKPAHRRGDAAFGKRDGGGWLKTLTLAQARDRLQGEIERFRVKSVVLSSNVELRLDGLPRSGQAEPADPGVALYFDLGGKPHVLACDTYRRVADNIAALAAHIEATRKIERYGVATAAEMFAGFEALPAPGSTPWWEILRVRQNAGRTDIEVAYRSLARERHPDVPGGSEAMMSELNTARDAALKDRL